MRLRYTETPPVWNLLVHALSDLPALLSMDEFAASPTSLCRLFHGRGHAWHGLDHVTVDWLPPVAWITLYKPESAAALKPLTDYLLAHLSGCTSVQVQHRYERHGPVDVLQGDAVCELVCEESGLKYQLTLGKNRNTGLFLDMAAGRRWVREHCAGKRVLNLFAYTCGFSVAAIDGGAEHVMNVDMISAPLTAGRHNHRLNGQALNRVSFDKLNVFKSFGRLKRRGPWDLLICDPPTRQKGSVDIAKDYAKILRRLPDMMSADSELLLCLNDPMHGADWLRGELAQHAPHYTCITALPPPKVFRDAQGKGLTVLHCAPNPRYD